MDDLQKSSTMLPIKGRLLHVLAVGLVPEGRNVGGSSARACGPTPPIEKLVIGFDIRVAAIALLTTSSTVPFTATDRIFARTRCSGWWPLHTFDYRDQVVLPAAVNQPLTPPQNVRMSIVRGGLHVSAQSDRTSLVLLPQQFSHCLRPHDYRVRLLRSDVTGMIFLGRVDTNISFGYGILSPNAGVVDLADLKQLQLKLAKP